jgi:glutamate-5-semialdehyde dehydrogenase
MNVETVAAQARAAAAAMAAADRERKDAVLIDMAARLQANAAQVAEANVQDMAAARRAGLDEHVIRRLAFGPAKLEARVRSLRKIAALPDPVGRVIRDERLANGLRAQRVGVPLGVILMIYEARPHVSINAGAFCMKAGNACILRGGSEAQQCNALLGRLWAASLASAGLPCEAVRMISGSHEQIRELLQLDGYIDLVIPRGGKALIRAVNEQSRIPVLKHFAGICHVYIDAGADPVTASRIVVDSKCLMPEVCNAAETLLVSANNPAALKRAVAELRRCGVRVLGCERTRAVCGDVESAVEADWETEYLDRVISVRVVEDVAAAVAHINAHGSHHTDSIVTPDPAAADVFRRDVDSAVVLVNASTMFCDGETLGMGAEIGISTDKLHARGPMGLEELTSYKFVINGEGQVMGNPETMAAP